MPLLLIVLDGVCNNEYEHIESLKHAIRRGSRNNTPLGMETDSLNCILTMLGVSKEHIPSGRAYLEALAAGLYVGPHDVVLRCNAIKTDRGALVSSCHTVEPVEIDGDRYLLKHLSGHKYLLVIKDAAMHLDSMRTHPPHQNIGRTMDTITPYCGDDPIQRILDDLVNRGLFPWGQAGKQTLPEYVKLHGINGAVVARTEIVVGMARAMNMHVETPNGATGDVDTDLTSKLDAALELCKDFNFVMLHVNGADESAHRINEREKVVFIKKIDEQVLKRVTSDPIKGLSIVVSADHETSAQTGCHINSETDYFILNEEQGCDTWLKR